MSGVKSRTEIIQPTDSVLLKSIWKDSAGVLINLDSFPTVSIVEPNGSVVLLPTSAGVEKISTGVYAYTYDVNINALWGIYGDNWVGILNGFPIQAAFQFAVNGGQEQTLINDGYYNLGTDVQMNYSQTAILNINKCVTLLRSRLSSSGKSKAKDAFGNVIYISCDIFSAESLVHFCILALSEFNQIPYFSFFTFEDTFIIDTFIAALVKLATCYALASKALIEKGREFTITDQGLSFNPPSVADMLNSQASALLTQTYEEVKYIKNSMRPSPRALGVYSSTSMAPAIMRNRMMRSRRIY